MRATLLLVSLGALPLAAACSSGGGRTAAPQTRFSGATVAVFEHTAGTSTVGAFTVYAGWVADPYLIDLALVEPSAGDCVYDQSVFPPPLAHVTGPGLDAGPTISFVGSSGAVAIGKMSGTQLYYGGGLALGPFEAHRTYTISGEGGPDVPAFSEAVFAPSSLLPLTPSISEFYLGAVDRQAGLPIAWASTNGTDLIVASVGALLDDGTTATATCSFLDTGSAVIPSAALEKLPSIGATLYLGKYTVGAALLPSEGLTYSQIGESWSWQLYLE